MPIVNEPRNAVLENNLIRRVEIDQNSEGSEIADDSFDEQDFEEHEPIDVKSTTALTSASRQLIQKDQR